MISRNGVRSLYDLLKIPMHNHRATSGKGRLQEGVLSTRYGSELGCRCRGRLATWVYGRRLFFLLDP